MFDERFARQTRLTQVGPEGQARLGSARVVVIGLGALGSVVAELLGRAGVGRGREGGEGGEGGLVIVDRDLVEVTNLQRQMLYAEVDVGTPKAVAAEKRLLAIDPGLRLRPIVTDISSLNVRELVAEADLIVEATDNAQTRYLVNDAAVELGKPWVYGGAIATEGRVTAFRPGSSTGPCLRCLFLNPPAPGELPTCDSVGVLNTVTATVASLQAQLALRMLLEPGWCPEQLVSMELWSLRISSISLVEAKNPDCPCCVHRRFDFLNAPPPPMVSLCGRDTLQVLPSASPGRSRVSLIEMEGRWRAMGAGGVTRTAHLLKLEAQPVSATLFADGRLLLHGLTDPSQARSWYDRLVGT